MFFFFGLISAKLSLLIVEENHKETDSLDFYYNLLTGNIVKRDIYRRIISLFKMSIYTFRILCIEVGTTSVWK